MVNHFQKLKRSEREQNILLEQLRNYKLRNSSYNSPFSFESGNVLNWWYTCEEDHDYLQEFAIKLFSVVPHSATCERSFSILDWYYGKKRQNLNITTIENMLKIHSYHLSNTEKELKYVGQNISDEELKNLISNAKLWLDDDDYDDYVVEEVEEENSVSDDISESESDFYEVEPNYEIDKKNNFVLEEIIDLNNSIFTDGNQSQIHLDVENNTNQLIDENYKYNSNDLINSFLNSFDDSDIINMNNIVNLESEADIANSYIYINNDGIDNNNHDDIIYDQDNFNNKDDNSNNSNDIDNYNNIPTNNNNKKTNLKRKNDCDDLPRKQFEFRDRKKKNYKI